MHKYILSKWLWLFLLFFLLSGVLGFTIINNKCLGFGLRISTECLRAIFTYTNQLENPLIQWEDAWKDKTSTLSGDEMNFSLTGGNSIVISAQFSNQQPGQKLHVIVNRSVYTMQAKNSRSNVIFIREASDFKSTNIKMWHYCQIKSACKVTINSVHVPRSSTVIHPQSSKKTIVFFGDSITNLYDDNNFSNQLSDSLGYVSVNLGVFGSTVTRVKDRDYSFLRYDSIISFKPEVIVIILGTNDLAFAVEQKNFSYGYKKLLTAIKKTNPQAKIYATGILNRKDLNVSDYNKIISDTASELNLSYIDTTDWLTSDDLIDEVHPSLQSQKKLAEKFSAVLKASK